MSAPDGGGCFCDANAGMAALPEVLDEFVRVERACPGNPASAHAAGREARRVLEQARERIASALRLRPIDVVFTSGGTEAANLAVRGLGAPELPVALGDAEHPAVREAAIERGIVPWRVDAAGRTIVTRPERPVGLLSLVHAQSELGTLQPIHDVIELGTELGVPVFVDAAQTLGREPVDIAAAGCFVALSPHKAGGVRGHGVLAGRDLTDHLTPLLRGGAQEFGVRAGTQSPALAAANALAIERAIAEQSRRASAMARVRSDFLQGVEASACRHQLLTPLSQSISNTAMLCFEGVEGRSLLPALDLAGVQASHGSACSSGSPTPPRILECVGLSERLARACVRFSFDWRSSAWNAVDVGKRVGETVTRLFKKM